MKKYKVHLIDGPVLTLYAEGYSFGSNMVTFKDSLDTSISIYNLSYIQQKD